MGTVHKEVTKPTMHQIINESVGNLQVICTGVSRQYGNGQWCEPGAGRMHFAVDPQKCPRKAIFESKTAFEKRKNEFMQKLANEIAGKLDSNPTISKYLKDDRIASISLDVEKTQFLKIPLRS